MSTGESPTASAPLNGATASPDTNTARLPSRSFLAIEPAHILSLLIGFRLLNALTVQTFFQPDEYFQALEPAWQSAFGVGSGAWITWEWKTYLRSAIHPALFGLCYQAADIVAEILKLAPHARSELLLAAPAILQAICAAVADFYTWKLASYIYGGNTGASLMALVLTVVSPWQWFCSTRTFSNSLEMTLTVMALYGWPWHWILPYGAEGVKKPKLDPQNLRVRDGLEQNKTETDETTRLRRSLLSAAGATILRPTNILVWIILTSLTFIHGWSSPGLSWAEYVVFVRETLLCGGVVMTLSAIVDRCFYGAWVFPPLNFLRVNVVQSLATFYGRNDWHYYLSQGYPLLLTTALPFTLIGMFRRLRSEDSATDASPAGRKALRSLAIVCLLVPAAFSNIAHKEVRFIYPLLPALHVVTALPLASFCGLYLARPKWPSIAKQILLISLLALNISIAYYTTQVHNSGLIHLTTFLRQEFESAYLPSVPPVNMTVGMFMPCHSTPWRSHLQYPPSSTHTGINAWALTCEPPLNLNASEKSTYLDEADQFYANPSTWLKMHMSRHPPQRKDGTRAAGVFARDPRSKHTVNAEVLDRQQRDEAFWATRQGRRPWPDYLVFFAQLEPTLHVALRGSGYIECKRLFNSHWHDDSRRVGDVVVWCLDAQRRDGPTPDVRLEDVEAAIHDPGAAAEVIEIGPGGQKILRAGGKGAKGDGNDGDKKEARRRVVDKPFWKVRDPDED